MSRSLFPKISSNLHEWLSVGDQHQIYLEQSGNPDGIAVIYLHGGPGAGCSVNHRRYFDPDIYRIIIFDQRGCGRSTPSPCIFKNTTADLILEIEKIRQHLGIKQLLIAAGGWGCTLALAYGIAYPKNVTAFILRGTFLATAAEFNWLYQVNGVEKFYPEFYLDFIHHLPNETQTSPLAGYLQLLNSDNEVAVIAASKAWVLWHLRLSTTEHHHIALAQVDDPHQALCMAKLMTHYFNHQCFFDENYLIDHLQSITNIPAIFLHGRYDMICPLITVSELTKVWQNSQLQILPNAGHSGFETQTIDAFCKATDTMAIFLNESY